MHYVSVEVGDIDDYWTEKEKYVSSIILMKKVNIRLPFWVTLTHSGDWIIYDTTPHCILTEKCNALIHLCHFSKAGSDKLLFNKYNVIKFLLLKQLLIKHLNIDILELIIDLMD